MSDSLKLGDIVFLKSGSRPLTVTKPTLLQVSEAVVEVTWWSDELDEILSRDLPIGALCYLEDLSVSLEDDIDDEQPANGGTTH